MLFVVVCDTWFEHQKISISRIFTQVNKNCLNSGKTYKRIFRKKKKKRLGGAQKDLLSRNQTMRWSQFMTHSAVLHIER